MFICLCLKEVNELTLQINTRGYLTIVTWAQPIFSVTRKVSGVCQAFGVCPDFDLVAEDWKVSILASLRGHV